jgi:hypothetical protein
MVHTVIYALISSLGMETESSYKSIFPSFCQVCSLLLAMMNWETAVLLPRHAFLHGLFCSASTFATQVSMSELYQ